MWLFLIIFKEVAQKAALPINLTFFKHISFKKYEYLKAHSPITSKVSPTNFSSIDSVKHFSPTYLRFTATSSLKLFSFSFSILQTFSYSISKFYWECSDHGANIWAFGSINTVTISFLNFFVTSPFLSYRIFTYLYFIDMRGVSFWIIFSIFQTIPH